MADSLLPDSADGPPERQNGRLNASVLVIGRDDHATLSQAALLGEQVFVVPVNGLDAELLAVSRLHHLRLRVLFLNGARALAASHPWLAVR